MAGQYVHLAVGRTNTQIYRFDPNTWDIELVSQVPAFSAGYTAMGERDGLLYAMSRHNLVTIDPVKGGTPTTQAIQDLPDTTWYGGDVTPDKKSLFICPDPNIASYDIDLAGHQATPGNPPGSGRWDDWAYHPEDGRLYAVEGDNGDLLLIDRTQSPMKQTLKQQVFPPAEQSSSGGRKSYSAVFFSEDGMFYAIDSKGNANALDLTASTRDHPITPSQIGTSQRLSRTPLPVDDLEVMNAAGVITKITPLDPPVITEPQDRAQYLDPSQAIKGTVTDGEGIDTVKVFELLDGQPQLLGPATLTTLTTWEFRPGRPWPGGDHTIQAVAYIGKRDSAPANVHFTVAVAPPVITAPKDGTTVDTDQVISGTMADGVDKVSLSEAGEPLGDATLSTGTGTWTYTPSPPWSEEPHTVQAVAHKADRTSQPATVHFTAKDPNLHVTPHFDSHWRKQWETNPSSSTPTP
ncbi:hypothetical protein [Streptomyces monomycini]|uniref:hypothetical protein n=1 Tax=Streptomyces monomycini TaxID=371720 RepID=UPI001EEB0B80|nr:hypothetical protein [Streptomyces monomycini]